VILKKQTRSEKSCVSLGWMFRTLKYRENQMKPIYFPFTYIPESVADSLSRFLGRIIVLQPVLNNQPELLHRLEEDRQIEIHVPFTEDEDRLNACSKDFQQWGRTHQGDEASLKDIFKDGFSNQTFTAQIRTDILKGDVDTVVECQVQTDKKTCGRIRFFCNKQSGGA
jgi:mRNA-degrading endonuclease YafQ of YafQ-DinJ toxin-antitoxin module